MNNPTVGTLLPEDAERDAIHVAIAPVTAGEFLLPGIRVAVVDGKAIIPNLGESVVGVVDPFLTSGVLKGQRFWVFLLPNTITSLRHEWKHPSFAACVVIPQEEWSQRWLTDYAREFDMSFEEIIQAARSYLKDGSIYRLGFDTPSRAYDDAEVFWTHYEFVTKETVHERSATFFACAC